MWLYFLKIIWFFLPMGVANMAPVFVKNINFLAGPIDFNKKLNDQPILGKNKTIRGLVAATLFGGIFYLLQKYLFTFDFFQQISLFDYQTIPWFAGFLMGLGAIVGDMVKSFLKRRFKINPGRPWIPFDQIDYVLGGTLFFSLFYVPTTKDVVFLLLIGLTLHIIVNIIGYYVGLREHKI